MTEYAISRDSRRVPLETRVNLRFERFSGFISEYSSNVSPGGMFVKTQSPSPVGTLLDFEFQLGDGYPLIKGTGEVAWIRSDDQGPNHPAGMGIRFLRLSKGSRELIYKMVDEYIHQGGVPFDVEHGPGEVAGATAATAEDEAPAAVTEEAPPAFPAPVPAFEPTPAPVAPPVVPAAAPASPALASLSLPDLAARTFGPTVEPSVVPPPPALAAPPPEPPPVPLAAHAAAHPPRRRTARLAALAAMVVVALGVVAFVFQEPLRRRLGLLGDDRAAAAAEPVAEPRTPASEPAKSAGAPSGAAPAAAAAASDDAIPEPTLAAAEGEEAAVPAAVTPDPAVTAPAPPPAATPAATVRARLTAIRGIDVRQVDGETEVTIRGDGPIAAGGYARDRLAGSSPREVIRIRGVERPFGRARVAVGSPHLKQVRTGHHVLPGGDELHVVLDLADSGVVVRAVREVDGALVLRLGRG